MNYAKRRETVLENIDSDKAVVAVSANNPVQASGSFEFPYRQDSNFRYLCGYNQPDATLVFAATESVLFVREPDEHDLLWDQVAADVSQLKQQSMVDEVLPLDQLHSWVQRHKEYEFFVPETEPLQHSRAQPNLAQKQLRQQLREWGVTEFTDAQEVIAEVRRVKDADEIEKIEQAVTITHRALNQLKLDVTYENQLESQLTKTFIDHNSTHAYNPIVASGKRATILHYRDNDAPLPDDGMVLIDVGAEIEGYAADVTRMFELGHAPSKQRTMLGMIEDLQQRAIKRIKPGVNIRELATTFRQELLSEAQTSGYLPKSAELKDTIDIMPHGLHHYLGLDVHDVGDYEQPLEPGVVLMVEPGLYQFAEGLGVRVEDAVVVTDDGCRMLAESIQ